MSPIRQLEHGYRRRLIKALIQRADTEPLASTIRPERFTYTDPEEVVTLGIGCRHDVFPEYYQVQVRDAE